MSKLTPEQVQAMLQVNADSKLTATWDKIQGRAVFHAIEEWFESKELGLWDAINAAAPDVLSDEAKSLFLKSYMQVKAVGIPKKRIPAGYYDDAHRVFDELHVQTDRATAIVGAAFLDAKLESALNVYFAQDVSNKVRTEIFSGPGSPLGTFSGKIYLAHALGIVGTKSFNDLMLIGRIRNRFAHRLNVASFDEPSIAADCMKLQMTDIRFLGEEAPKTARDKFINSVINTMHFVYSEVVAGSDIGEHPTKSP